MKKVIQAIALTASFALVGLPQKSFAQAPNGAVVDKPSQGLWQILPRFDFGGGSVSEFTDALRLAASPRELNIIVLDQLPETKIAPVKLRDISVQSALQLLRGPLAQGPIDVTWTIAENVMDNPVIYIQRPALVATNRPDGKPLEQHRKTAVLSIQIGPQAKGEEQKNRELLMAVTRDALGEALELGNRSGKDIPEFKFHQPSGLLFVVGEPSDIAIAREVVDRIVEDARLAAKSKASANEIAALNQELETLKGKQASAAKEAVKAIEVHVRSDGVNILDLRQAVESAMKLVPVVSGRTLEVSADPDGLVLRGDRELVRNAENAAIGARTAFLMLKSRQTPSNGSSVEQR